jgi:hypothetical protein
MKEQILTTKPKKFVTRIYTNQHLVVVAKDWRRQSEIRAKTTWISRVKYVTVGKLPFPQQKSF